MNVISNHLSQDFFGLHLPLLIPTVVNLSLLLTETCVSSLHMPESSQFRLPHLFHLRGHSHLVPDSFVPNTITPSMLTHSSQHPHLRYSHPLGM